MVAKSRTLFVIAAFVLNTGLAAAQRSPERSPTLIHEVHPPTDPVCLTGPSVVTGCGRALVSFRITINVDGSVGNPVVLFSAPSTPDVVKTAMSAVVQWRYLPVAVPVTTSVNVQWTSRVTTPGPPAPTSLPPRAPENVQATYANGILTITWTPPPTTDLLGNVVSGAPESYVIRAGYLPSILDLAEVDTGSLATTFSAFVPPGFPPPDTSGRSINPGGVLFLGVYARNAAGMSAASIVSVITGTSAAGCTTAPAAPTSLTVTVHGQRVVLAWGVAPGATSYALEAGSQSGAANLASVNVGAQTTFEATAPFGTYFVRTRGVNSCGVGPPSNEVIAVVSGGTVPSGGALRPCSETRLSITSLTPVPVEFVNVSSQPRLLYWVDFAGIHRPYGVLMPGQSGFLTSFVTHSWVFTDAANACLGTLVIAGGGRIEIP